MRVLTKDEANEVMDLIYIETESGFHIGIDASYIDQVKDFKLKLPTGEIINTKEIN